MKKTRILTNFDNDSYIEPPLTCIYNKSLGIKLEEHPANKNKSLVLRIF